MLVIGHVTFVLQQLFQISLERGLRFNHRIERFLHLGRQLICIDACHFNSSRAIILLQLGRNGTLYSEYQGPISPASCSRGGVAQLPTRQLCNSPLRYRGGRSS